MKGEEDAREKELNDCLFAGAPKSPGTFSGNLVNGIEILSDTPNGRGTIRLASNTTFLSSGSVCGLLNSLRPQADRMLVDQVRAFANPKIKPFSVRSDARSQLTSACTARAEVRSAGGENLTLTVKLPRNIFFFNVTTPGPLPGGTDPRFSIDYDLEARIPISIPARPRDAIGFGPVSVSVTNIKPDSQNLTGDIVKGLNSVVTFITGKDLAAKYLQNQYMSFAGVRKNLTDLSAQLNRVPANYRIDKSVNGTTLVLRATGKAPPPGPVVR